MSLKRLFLFAVVFLCMAEVWSAKAAYKKAPVYIKILDASSKKVRSDDQARVDYRFIIIWKGSNYPEAFFWRGENGWLTCNLSRAHKVKKAYTAEPVINGDIHKGDTLELIPVTGGRFPIPAEIPKTAKNTLFYKTAGSSWLSIKINKIDRR